MKTRQHIYLQLSNVAIAAIVLLLILTIGLRKFLLIQLPVIYIASVAGVWLFYVQHQFEDVYWEHRDDWDYTTAALEGSSYYKLPKVLQWFTGNIGFHHIHHLSSRVPNYYLEDCHNSHPLFYNVKPITLRSSLKCINLRLYDEESKQLIGYKQFRKIRKDREAKLRAS
jgi:omega-6 fatty acid desaturase (delta-12 desaturase)